MISFPECDRCRFQFDRDTFAFANELFWEYRMDPSTGAVTTFRNTPPPRYAHRCFVMVRSARQFLYHARFDATQPVADAPTYRHLIRAVVSRNPRRPSPDASMIVIPGYDNLRALSQAQESLLKAECGGAWQSYCLRSHWRMVFPISRQHQEQTARQLLQSFRTRWAPIVHLVRFPQLTINHGIVLMDATETDTGIQFAAYDPNVPAHPTELTYRRAERTFHFPRNHYWAGGPLNVIEVYRGWIY